MRVEKPQLHDKGVGDFFVFLSDLFLLYRLRMEWSEAAELAVGKDPEEVTKVELR